MRLACLASAPSRSRTFLEVHSLSLTTKSKERLFRRDAETSARDACATRRPPQFDLAFRRGSFYENLYENDLDFPPQICAATERRRCSGSRQACAFAWKTTRTQCCKYGRCALECKRKSLWTFAESA